MKINDNLSALCQRKFEALGPEKVLEAFEGVLFGPFVQDVNDWTDPETGEVHKASFDYFGHLRGWRISDKTCFAVRIRLEHEAVGILEAWNGFDEKSLAYIESHVDNAVLQFAEYSTCACVVSEPCERHRRDVPIGKV